MAGELHPRETSYERGEIVAGKYEIERRIGAGGMGVVLAVRHRELGELYALKLMLPAARARSTSAFCPRTGRRTWCSSCSPGRTWPSAWPSTGRSIRARSRA